jgi:hypothetical protein
MKVMVKFKKIESVMIAPTEEIGILEVRAIRRCAFRDNPNRKMLLLVLSDTVDADHSIIYANSNPSLSNDSTYSQICSHLYYDGFLDLVPYGETYRLSPDDIKMWGIIDVI